MARMRASDPAYRQWLSDRLRARFAETREELRAQARERMALESSKGLGSERLPMSWPEFRVAAAEHPNRPEALGTVTVGAPRTLRLDAPQRVAAHAVVGGGGGWSANNQPIDARGFRAEWLHASALARQAEVTAPQLMSAINRLRDARDRFVPQTPQESMWLAGADQQVFQWWGEGVGRGFWSIDEWPREALSTGLVAGAFSGGGTTPAARTPTTVNPDIALSPRLNSNRSAEISSTAKGRRPNPYMYMPQSKIDAHLAQFDAGASRFVLRQGLDKYGLLREDGTTFVMTRGQADQVVSAAAGDMRKLEALLGLPERQLDSGQLVRIDIASPRQYGLRLPSGNEAGANSQWIPGGVLPGGSIEAVILPSANRPVTYSQTLITPGRRQ